MRLLDRAVPRLRRVALRNLELAMPEADPAPIIDGCFASLGRVLAAVAHFPRITRENVHEWIVYDGFSHFEAALARGRGVLFATGHLGNWELSAFAHALMTAPMSFVVRPLDNPLLDALSTATASSPAIASSDAATSCAPWSKRSTTTKPPAS
jgi:Kdo2-lipid IVA lauroyltransferase/acyltransferase